MVTVEDFSRLVAGIYAAPVAEQGWQEALRDLHRTLDGIIAGILLTEGAAWSLENSTLPAEAARNYAEYYYRLDRVLADVEHGPVGVVRTGAELMPLVWASEFYEDWLRPLDIDDGLFVRLTNGPRPTSLIVAAPERGESFDTPERVKLMTGVVPHFQQALRYQGKLAALANSAVELADALEAVRYGVVVVAADHVVSNLNSAAERIIRSGDGLHVRSGRIAATNPRAEEELQSAIRLALDGEHSTCRRGHSLTCFRPSGKRPFVIQVLPSHRGNADEPHGQPVALVLIVDPEDEPEPAASLLRRLYRLTRAEAEVALRVLHGANVKEIAEQASVSPATVRTHLQRVFDKTDTHRQAELVRVLLDLCP